MEAQRDQLLTSAESDAWMAFASVLTWLPAAVDARLRNSEGITSAEFTVLAWLAGSPGRAQRMSETAAACSVTPSHLTRIVGRLEQRGWVRRTLDAADRRATLTTLTEEGARKVAASAPEHARAAMELVIGKLTPGQVTQLRDISNRLNDVGSAARDGQLR